MSETPMVAAVKELQATTVEQTVRFERAVQSAATTTTPVVDVNGFSVRQKAWAGLTIIGFLIFAGTGTLQWGRSMMTDMIQAASREASVERQRSDDREKASREHGDRAVDKLATKFDEQTGRIEKAIHIQTMMMDRNLQKSIEIQQQLLKKSSVTDGQ